MTDRNNRISNTIRSRDELKKWKDLFQLDVQCHRFYSKTANSYEACRKIHRLLHVRTRDTKSLKYDKSNRCSGYNYKVVV